MTATGGPGSYYPPGMGLRPPRHRVRWGIVVIGVVFIALAILLLFVALYPASFGVSASPRFGLFGGVFLLFFLLILGFFILRVAFWSTRMSYRSGYGGGGGPGGFGPGPRGGMGGPNRPLYVARMRYARGEITREQYEQIVQDLSRPPGPPS